jgi:glycerol-3-phosphate acyltransferase PlsY
MLTAVRLITALIVSYLIGSIPTAYIFGKLIKKIDIRKYGSGNVGATNAFRVLGRPVGILVLAIDILKGMFATTIVPDRFGIGMDIFRMLIGIAAVSGHNWTIFLNFKGGKGVATSVGVLFGLSLSIPNLSLIFGLIVIVWLIVLFITGFVSLSSMIAAFCLPVFMLVFKQSFELVILGVIFCIFIVWRHKLNIKRLLSGNESRLKFSIFKRKRFPQ